MKKSAALTLLFAVLLASAHAKPVKERSVMFQFGLGFARIDYSSEMNELMDEIGDQRGIEELTVYVDIGLGFSAGPKSYVLLSVSGVGDRLYDSESHLQVNTILYACGFRYYPFTTGLLLGADAGVARCSLKSDMGIKSDSDWGPGARAFVGYDFARKPSGFSLILGLSATVAVVDGDLIDSAQICLDLAWK